MTPSPILQVITALPFYAIVVFCCYSLATIGVGLVNFPDCTEAHTELLEDIQRVRQQLTKQGFTAW